MEELFGISMNTIMYVLVALLALALGSVVFVALRNQIMFKMGVRNIPRRRAQTVLIVIGLMLSTVIISAAFSTGDTVNHSITSQVYTLLGSVDEVVTPRVIDDYEAFDDTAVDALRPPTMAATDVAPLIDQAGANPEVDFVLPAYSGFAVAVNPDRRLSAPEFNVLGLDASRAQGLPDITNVDGGRLSVSDLTAGEIYVNESAAEELAVEPGDRVQLQVFGQQHDFRVKAVIEDKRLAGSAGISTRREGGVLPLAAVQSMFDAPGLLTTIFVSNEGDARSSLVHSDAVEEQLNASADALEASRPDAPALSVGAIKRVGVDIAEENANLFTTFFLVLGLFSIGAGVLLIFMIFVMLAAERKSEMGMARAVGTKRGDLVQTFLSEGMAYNLLAALVGTAIGVVVTVIMSEIMAALLAAADITISPHVTLRSLIISYSLGVVLTFLTVTFSSWRVSYINIVRAIRDIPEPPIQKPLWGTHGFFSTLKRLLIKSGSKKAWALRAGLAFAGIIVQGIGGSSGSDGAQALLGTLGAFLLVAAIFLTFQFGPLFILVSLPLIAIGADSGTAFPLLLGLSLLPLGMALVIRSFGANERITYTLAGLFLIYIWEFDFSVGILEAIFGETTGDIEMFFLSGVMVTIAATFLVVYNSDVILKPLTGLGKQLGALLPSIKMAVAYPLASKMRTGMTMAMFCLVVFALTVISSMNYNFNRLFLSDRALGGWDVVVDEHPTNPIGDLNQALTAAGSSVVSQIDETGVSSIGSGRVCAPAPDQACDVQAERPSRPGILTNDSDFSDYTVWGDSPDFLATAQLSLQARAAGYASDEAVWQAVARDPTLAVVDAFSLPGEGFGAGGFLEGVEAGDTEFTPVPLVIVDNDTLTNTQVTVIGIIELGTSGNYSGVHVAQSTFNRVFDQADQRVFFVKTVDGSDNVEVAREIESALLTTGVQAESLREVLDEQSEIQEGFLYLMQGFMGLGLFVGVAAVGVIAFRTVVERRQQIGMLRALGYTRGMIGLTFMIESAFIAFMGVLSGVVFAVILARQLITDEFANQGVTTFAVPWLQIGVIAGLAFGFALLMTLIPSRQAASIPIAQALRYE
jgi:putative ABC transport system permease protein